MSELKTVLFFSNHAADTSVMADFLRTYGLLLEEGSVHAVYGQAGHAEEAGHTEPAEQSGFASQEGEAARLVLNWAPAFASLTIQWAWGGNAFTHQEQSTIAPFAETEENRRRRIMRLCFFHMLEGAPRLQEILDMPPSPWGVLTGVRPGKMVQRLIDQGFGDDEIKAILVASFGLEDSRARLLLDVCQMQAPYLPGLDSCRKRISLYLCFPFCPSRCSYCSFPGYEAKRWKKWIGPCLEAMEKEIRQVGLAATRMGFHVETLYFGGGTPTCMSPEQMDRLLWAIRESFDLMPKAEWTVEGGRPETLTDEMLAVLAAHPVNRVCINPQSMNQSTLDMIGRLHGAADTEEAFRRVRDVMGKEGRQDWQINSDLILGLPGEGLSEVKASLEGVLALEPDNVTVHCLALKRGSAYRESRSSQPGRASGSQQEQEPGSLQGQEPGSQLEQEPGSLPDRMLGLSMIALTREMLANAGYSPYYLYRQKDSMAGGENVGYSIPGRECRYNILMIEERQTILGMGAGAGSKFLHPGDWTLENLYNPKDMIQYIQRIDELIARKVDKLSKI